MNDYKIESKMEYKLYPQPKQIVYPTIIYDSLFDYLIDVALAIWMYCLAYVAVFLLAILSVSIILIVLFHAFPS